MSLPSVARAVALCVCLPTAVLGQSRASTGFEALSGSWSGTGSITLNSGVERIRCQATYEVVPSGTTLNQDLRCTSDSYNFNIRASLVRNGDSLAGTWTETVRNAQGSLAGRVSGSQIQATIRGPAFTASLSMQTQAGRQTVNIRSQGTELSAVSIVLRRA